MNSYNNYNTNSPGPGPNTPGPGSGSNNQGDWIDVASWIVDIGLIFAIWPVGVALTVAKNRGHDVVGNLLRSLFEKGGQTAPAQGAARTTSSRVSAAPQGRTTSSRVGGVRAQQTGQTPQQTGRTTQQTGQAAPGQASRTKEDQAAGQEKTAQRADAGSTVKEVFGWIVFAFGALLTLSGVLGSASVWTILTTIAVALGGGVLVFSGRQGKKKEAAFRRCLTVSGDKGVVRMQPLAKTLGMTEEELEKQLSEMIDRGYYGGRAYIDHARGLLVIEPEFMRDVYRAEDEAKAKQAEQAQRDAQTEYERYVERIRQADVDIEDETMSEKIRRMQSITEAIFSEVELHPEKKPQIERFMSYYLPTSLKLLESYARIEEQGVSGENTAKAKADIERIADTLVEGYRKQLDTLYQSEAVDIAGDVSVIESMMRRDGLTGQDDFRPFKRFVEPASSQAAAQEAARESAQEEPKGEVLGGH